MTERRRYAEVIGDPIAHSLSPRIHRFWLEQTGIDADYRPERVARGALPDFLAARRRDPDWLGCNVTMPLKLDALTLADEASDRAVATGATNLLVKRDDRLLAGNTDVGAVTALVGKLADSGAPMGAITLLGTGGGARAALMGLHLRGINSVCIQSRDLSEAFKLAVEFRLDTEPVPFDRPIASDGLINATPLGMAGQLPLELELESMPTSGWVYDFVTAPPRTALLAWAEGRGMATVSGVEMVVEQAAESFRLLFGADPPRDKDAGLRAQLQT